MPTNSNKLKYIVPKLDRHSSRLKSPSENIVVNLKRGVVSTGGNIKLKNEKGKIIEILEYDSETIQGGIYSVKTYLHDYPYNNIALSNQEIFPYLADYAGEKYVHSEQTDETRKKWSQNLREPLKWNISIDNSFYTLYENSGWDTDEYYNYHSTTPEFNTNIDIDKSGTVDFVLSPFGGIKKLTINPKKDLKPGELYTLDFMDSGLISASGDLETATFNELCFTVYSKKNRGKHDNYQGCNTHMINKRNDNIFAEMKDRINSLRGGVTKVLYLGVDYDGIITAKRKKKGGTTSNVATFDSPLLAMRKLDIVTSFAKKSTTLFGEAVKKDNYNYIYYSSTKSNAIAELSIEKDYLKLFNTAKEMKGYFDVDLRNNTIEIWNNNTDLDLMFTLRYYGGPM
jgi:hypothetical protein